MKSVTLIAAIAFTAMAGGALAQQAPTDTTSGSTPGTNTVAPKDANQAVATTAASTGMPAHGANSFTLKEARRRIAHHGFTQVKDLTKDDQGVWHGTAMQNGAPVKVWEDYKGSVGTE